MVKLTTLLNKGLGILGRDDEVCLFVFVFVEFVLHCIVFYCWRFGGVDQMDRGFIIADGMVGPRSKSHF